MFCILHALLARAGIRTACIGHDGARFAVLDRRFGNVDGRRRHGILREDARDGSLLFRANHGDVEVAALLNAGLDARRLESLGKCHAFFCCCIRKHLYTLLYYG